MIVLACVFKEGGWEAFENSTFKMYEGLRSDAWGTTVEQPRRVCASYFYFWDLHLEWSSDSCSVTEALTIVMTPKPNTGLLYINALI